MKLDAEKHHKALEAELHNHLRLLQLPELTNDMIERPAVKIAEGMDNVLAIIVKALNQHTSALMRQMWQYKAVAETCLKDIVMAKYQLDWAGSKCKCGAYSDAVKNIQNDIREQAAALENINAAKKAAEKGGSNLKLWFKKHQVSPNATSREPAAKKRKTSKTVVQVQKKRSNIHKLRKIKKAHKRRTRPIKPIEELPHKEQGQMQQQPPKPHLLTPVAASTPVAKLNKKKRHHENPSTKATIDVPKNTNEKLPNKKQGQIQQSPKQQHEEQQHHAKDAMPHSKPHSKPHKEFNKKLERQRQKASTVVHFNTLGEQGFECIECKTIIRHRGNCAAHWNLLHSNDNKKVHACHLCDASFQRGNDLTRHVKNQHTCSVCMKEFAHTSAMKEHKKSCKHDSGATA